MIAGEECPICFEGDTLVASVVKHYGRWHVVCASGLRLSDRNGCELTFASKAAAVAFATEWYSGVSEEMKKVMADPKSPSGAGNKVRDGAKQLQRMKFIAARHGGVFH